MKSEITITKPDGSKETITRETDLSEAQEAKEFSEVFKNSIDTHGWKVIKMSLL